MKRQYATDTIYVSCNFNTSNYSMKQMWEGRRERLRGTAISSGSVKAGRNHGEDFQNK